MQTTQHLLTKANEIVKELRVTKQQQSLVEERLEIRQTQDFGLE